MGAKEFLESNPKEFFNSLSREEFKELLQEYDIEVEDVSEEEN